MAYRVFLLGILLEGVSMTLYADPVSYNIIDFGASVNNNASVNTIAINRAISECSTHGGGRVEVPAGCFCTGTIFMKDNVELHLFSGACLCASNNINDFPIQPQAHCRSQKDVAGWSALIFAQGANHISLTGSGEIDGRGRSVKGRISGVPGDCNGRPRNILFISCYDVLVTGITIRNAATWNQHYLDCEDVFVDKIKVYNHCNSNNDGIDIDGCRRFTLSNSIIDSDDDGIVLKSTGPEACQNIIVKGCIVSSFANAIKCGTESIGGFHNILITDCIIKPSKCEEERIVKSTPSGITAISLEVVDGGVMDGVLVSDIIIQGTECPLYVRLGNRARKYMVGVATPPLGVMRNISISNITAYDTGNFCSSITGIPERKIENIYLHNIRFFNHGELVKGNYLSANNFSPLRHDMAGNLNTDKYWASFYDVKEDENGYPQPTIWGNLPSYGLFIRHVENFVVEQASFYSQQVDPRVSVIAVDVNSLYLHRINAQGNFISQVVLHDVKKIDTDCKIVKK